MDSHLHRGMNNPSRCDDLCPHGIAQSVARGPRFGSRLRGGKGALGRDQTGWPGGGCPPLVPGLPLANNDRFFDHHVFHRNLHTVISRRRNQLWSTQPTTPQFTTSSSGLPVVAFGCTLRARPLWLSLARARLGKLIRGGKVLGKATVLGLKQC